MKYKASIQPLFYFSNTGGRGNLTLDSIVNKDDVGLPYISGTAIKGILLESMEEVLAMAGKNVDEITEITDKFFGKPGSKTLEGKLTIKTARLPNYELAYQYLKNSDIDALDRTNVASYFTSVVAQTRLDDNGIADKGSLRTMEVVDYKKAPKFEFELTTIANLDQSDSELLQQTIDNVWHLGLNRNRGLGRVKLSIEGPSDTTIESESIQPDNLNKLQFIELVISTKDPLVLSTQRGDQNTIHTEDVIGGSKIFGSLAYHLFQSDEPDKEALFEEIFLSEKVQFSDALYEGGIVFPLNLQRRKYPDKNSPDTDVINQFEAGSSKIASSTIHGFFKDGQLHETKKSFVFHNSRRNRTAGSSQKNDRYGSIFYYECIEAHQEFRAKITGPQEILQKLLSIFPRQFELSFGASRSVQYGSTTVTINPITESIAQVDDDILYFICQAPCILMDEHHMSKPSLELLSTSLGEGMNITDSFARYVDVKSYNTMWGGKTPVYHAYRPGSVFRVHNKNKKSFSKYHYLGSNNSKGFGLCYVATDTELEQWKMLKKEPKGNKEKIIDGVNTPIDVGYINEIKKEYSERLIKLKITIDRLPKRLTNHQLNNHQLSQLEGSLLHKNSQDWQKYIVDIKDKPLGRALTQHHLYDDLLNKRSLFDSQQHGTYVSFTAESIHIIKLLRLLKK